MGGMVTVLVQVRFLGNSDLVITVSAGFSSGSGLVSSSPRSISKSGISAGGDSVLASKSSSSSSASSSSAGSRGSSVDSFSSNWGSGFSSSMHSSLSNKEI